MAAGGTRDSMKREIAAVREFNRFYTARLGLLRRRHLNGDFSLSEARLLYEIGAKQLTTATALRGILQLDAGYLSRLLAALTRRRLVGQVISRKDAREKQLVLAPAGRRALARINLQSDEQLQQMLASVSPAGRQSLVASLEQVRRILSAPSIRVERAASITGEAVDLLNEYYEAVQVVKRDTLAGIRKLFRERGSGMWLARLNGEVVGCVVLRRLASIARASECKRLYVKPAARGHAIGDRLLEAMEDHARKEGLDWIYLDSYDDLKTAIALYERRGYEHCRAYNANPQATLFMRKRIGT